jgi:hypothetical protein
MGPTMAFRLRPSAAAALAYVSVTALIGRDVLGRLSTSIVHDTGDPLLTASILYWNATHVPLTDAWWQFPIFYPTRDALAFSEHLLGLSVVSAPLQWLIGDPLIVYNLTVLLTFPLCALAMYALVRRLTGSAAGAFVAGLAFGFAPYRMSQLPHIQVLAAFWAPLALLGLHAYVETHRSRWLALFGVSWLLQGFANGYALVFFSVLVALWVIWFVVCRRRWRALAEIAAAGALALLPLVPVILKYMEVHARHGFIRDIEEVRFFSADLAAVLCATPLLTVWGWVQVGCRPEGQLFPGVATLVLAGVALARVAAPQRGAGELAVVRWLRWALGLFAIANVIIAAIVAVHGPLRIDIGPLRISSSSVDKPLLLSVGAMLLAVAASPGLRQALAQSSAIAFYVSAALATWMFALGPTVTILGRRGGVSGPYAWLMLVPGAESLRVPARFWLFTTLCLAAAVGFVVAAAARRRRTLAAAAVVVVASAAVLADGWARIPAVPVPSGGERIPDPAGLRGKTVLRLPAGDVRDIEPSYQAVVGGWRSVNGYSGYVPSYYWLVADAVRHERDELLEFFQSFGELHVLVPADAPRLRQLVERQAGATLTAQSPWLAQFRLPPKAGQTLVQTAGERLPVARVEVSCGSWALASMTDGSLISRWDCGLPQDGREEVRIDLGRLATVGAVVDDLGPWASNFPRHLVVETSVDGTVWQPGWDGDVLELMFAVTFAEPKRARLVVPLVPRIARYIRLRQTGKDPAFYWSIAELEIWSDSARTSDLPSGPAGRSGGFGFTSSR